MNESCGGDNCVLFTPTHSHVYIVYGKLIIVFYVYYVRLNIFKIFYVIIFNLVFISNEYEDLFL